MITAGRATPCAGARTSTAPDWLCGLGFCGPLRGEGRPDGSRVGVPKVRITSSSASSTPASRRTPSVMRSGVG